MQKAHPPRPSIESRAAQRPRASRFSQTQLTQIHVRLRVHKDIEAPRSRIASDRFDFRRETLGPIFAIFNRDASDPSLEHGLRRSPTSLGGCDHPVSISSRHRDMNIAHDRCHDAAEGLDADS